MIPIRRPPLITFDQVAKSKEGRDMISYAIENGNFYKYVRAEHTRSDVITVMIAPPGTAFRWEKMLQIANRTIEPTEDQPDPIRLEITMETLKTITKAWYESEDIPEKSDEITLLREYLPKLYDKHNYERGRRVSQKERDDKGISDGAYAYGELECEDFIRILFKIRRAFGEVKGGMFYDMGCGVGNLVFAACMVGSFRKVVGIDNIKSLVDRGEKRMTRWQMFSENFTKTIKDTVFDWIQDDFLEADFWSDATLLLLHWTAFSHEQRLAMAERIKMCSEGTLVIALTEPIPNSDLEVLTQGICKTSWGQAVYFVQEKMSPAGR